jgi:hypothetical protein
MRSRRYKRKSRKQKSKRGGSYYRLNKTPMYFTDVSKGGKKYRGGGDTRYMPVQPAVNMFRGLGHGLTNTWRDITGSYPETSPDVLDQPLGKKYW